MHFKAIARNVPAFPIHVMSCAAHFMACALFIVVALLIVAVLIVAVMIVAVMNSSALTINVRIRKVFVAVAVVGTHSCVIALCTRSLAPHHALSHGWWIDRPRATTTPRHNQPIYAQPAQPAEQWTSHGTNVRDDDRVDDAL